LSDDSDKDPQMIMLYKIAKNEFDHKFKYLISNISNEDNTVFGYTLKQMANVIDKNSIEKYMLFSIENFFLRNYNIESPYTQPLGSKGEGLLKLIKVIKQEKPEQYKEIIENLHLIDWFSDIDITEDSLAGTEFKLNDIYLEEGIGGFDIRNANEGFFLLLFYITLFVSDYTPAFFAIDNIDTALNPKLCTKLIEVLTGLAVKHNKQVWVTAHNPAILDGINLNDQDQRLFVVSRNKSGYTRATRVEKKEPLEGRQSVKLSEQFLRGYIGGIPKNF
jgi:AAA15 family ATPase/GTPase